MTLREFLLLLFAASLLVAAVYSALLLGSACDALVC